MRLLKRGDWMIAFMIALRYGVTGDTMGGRLLGFGCVHCTVSHFVLSVSDCVP
jgi:hypothetical protein